MHPVLTYWRNGLAGAPSTIAVPTDRPRPAVQSFRGGLVRFELPPTLTASLRSAALREQCTLFMFLLTGFAVTLHRRSGQTDMLIGSVSGGRDRPELERLIGYFLRILVIRADLTGDPSFRELLQRVRRVLVEALSHDAMPFQRLVRALAPARDLGRSPLFQVTFSIEPPLPALGAEWDLTEMDAGTTVSKFDLSLELEDRGEVIGGRAIYSRDLFDPDDHRVVDDRVCRGAGPRGGAPGRPGLDRGRERHMSEIGSGQRPSRPEVKTSSRRSVQGGRGPLPAGHPARTTRASTRSSAGTVWAFETTRSGRTSG